MKHSLATAEGAQAQLNESGMQHLVLEILGLRCLSILHETNISEEKNM